MPRGTPRQRRSAWRQSERLPPRTSRPCPHSIGFEFEHLRAVDRERACFERPVQAARLKILGELLDEALERVSLVGVGVAATVIVVVITDPDEPAAVASAELEAESEGALQRRLGCELLD
jgi:hypothetical protein